MEKSDGDVQSPQRRGMLKLHEDDINLIFTSDRLAKRADVGPWDEQGREAGQNVNVYQVRLGPNNGKYTSAMICSSYYKGHHSKGNVEKNMKFIAHSREAVPELVNLLRKALTAANYAADVLKTHPHGEDFINEMQHILNGTETDSDNVFDLLKFLDTEEEKFDVVW